jgi:hypothetical protein
VVDRPRLESRYPESDRRAVVRNLALDMVGALGVGVTLALVTALLPAIARRAGVTPLGLSALAAAPFVANLLSAFAGRWGPRSAGQLAAIRGAGAASLLMLAVMPRAATMIAVVLIYCLSLSFSNPFQLRLWGALYPASVVGRVIGFLGMGRAASGALAALAGGVVADRLGVPIVVIAIGAVGVSSAAAYAGLRARSNERPAVFSARGSIRALRASRLLNRVALAQGFYGGGLIAAVPLYALVHVDRLHLSLSDVGVIGVLLSAATTLSYPIWGSISDRFGPLASLRVGSTLGIVALVGYAFAPSVAFLWPMVIALGTANSSIDVGIAAIVSRQTPLASRAAALAGLNAITGARGIAAAFVMSALLSLGLVSVTSALLLCAISAAIGVVMFARVAPSSPATERTVELTLTKVPVSAKQTSSSSP